PIEDQPQEEPRQAPRPIAQEEQSTQLAQQSRAQENRQTNEPQKKSIGTKLGEFTSVGKLVGFGVFATAAYNLGSWSWQKFAVAAAPTVSSTVQYATPILLEAANQCMKIGGTYVATQMGAECIRQGLNSVYPGAGEVLSAAVNGTVT